MKDQHKMAIGTYFTVYYEPEWADVWRPNQWVQTWQDEFPDQFGEEHLHGTHFKAKDLDSFALVALMYILRKEHGIKSIAWYGISDTSNNSKHKERFHRYWEVMKHWMGINNFLTLQKALLAAGFQNEKGEPDLFCWHEKTGEWFFAEAKGKGDKLNENQIKWHMICRDLLGDVVKVGKVRMKPQLLGKLRYFQ